MNRQILLVACVFFACACLPSANAACTYDVTKWDKFNYTLGDDTVTVIKKCPSGYTSRPADTFLIELSVLSQTLVEGVFPDISGDDADIYTCPEGFKYINLEGPIQSCIGNNARNPRFALVNGVAEFVCKNQARRRFISVNTSVQYNRTCT